MNGNCIEQSKRWVDSLQGELESWELAELETPEGLKDAFSGDLHFGTGGIRCLMGIGPNRMNRLTIGKAAQGLANWLYDKRGLKRVAIGYDTRIHSREFAEVTARVLASNGIRALVLSGPQPTPVLDFAVRNLGCCAGVVITASHNPREYNGFKVYGPDGVQATDAMAHAIQTEIERVDPFEDVSPMSIEDALSSGLVGLVGDDLLDSYHEAVLARRLWADCSDLHVVYSPLNGTGLTQVERMLNALSVSHTLVESQAEPDGNFPNCPKPNPENPSAMARGMAQMATEGADLFLATDPDADRVGVACMDGGVARLLTGNEVGLLLLDYVCRVIPHGGDGVAVTTIVTAPLADAICEANGVELRRTLTGFKYVGEQIGHIEAAGGEFLLGIEESDGYLRGSYVRDKDGINGLMLVCEVAAHYKALGMTLVDALAGLYARYGHMPGRQLVREFPGAAGMASMDRLMGDLRQDPPTTLADLAVQCTIDYLHGAPMPVVAGESSQHLPPANVLEWRLEGGSRVLVRPSGTEPKLKAYVFARAAEESEAAELLDALCASVSNLVSKREDRMEGGPMTHVVLLSGGSGTRLWPLSNSARSKQFLKVLRDADGNHVSMVQRVFGQIDAVDADLDITIATSASQRDALAMQVGGRYRLSVEPERRDTAPAIMLAAAHLDLVQGASPDDPVIVMPIDTYADQAYYDRIPAIAAQVASGASDLVLLGVEPTYPSEKYGYIIPASTEGDAWPVETFREKPDEETARGYIERGGLWNCGVFGFRLGWLRELTKGYLDADSYDDYVERYRDLPRNSFDYEVVEKAQSIRVVPYAGTWKDLGTWSTLAEEMADQTAGQVWLDGDTINNVHAVNETGLPMVVAGVSDAVVVATPDGILVTGKDASAHIKGLVEEASYARPMCERRQWGEYRVMDEQEYEDGSHTLTKELVLKVNRQLSCQRHRHRAEVWTVVAGTGEVVLDGEVITVKVGDCVRIAPMQMHGARAITELHIVEVQVGWPLVEEDIERFGFFWDLEGYDA